MVSPMDGRDPRSSELAGGPEHGDVPTAADLLATPKPTCITCGSDAIRSDSPAMRWTLVVGGGMSAIVLFRGFVEVAIMLLITTVTLAAGVRARYHFRRCDRCGHEWRRTEERLDS